MRKTVALSVLLLSMFFLITGCSESRMSDRADSVDRTQTAAGPESSVDSAGELTLEDMRNT